MGCAGSNSMAARCIPTITIFRTSARDTLHHIVIVGGGAAGLELATGLGNKLGKRPDTKRAIVSLAPGDRIEIFGGPGA